MVGYWEVKPENTISAYKCLAIDEEDILEIVNLSFDPEREVREYDKEFLVKMVRDGFTSGQFDSGVDY